VAIMFLITP